MHHTAVEIRLLGPVEVRHGAVPIELGHTRQRCVFAALSEPPNKPLSVEQLISRTWDDNPPDSARQTLQAYISRLRRAFTCTNAIQVHYRAGSYALKVEAKQIDLWRFMRTTRDAREAAAAGADDRAVRLFDTALDMWRGEALSDLTGHWAEGVRARMAEERFAALEDRIDAELRRGRHAPLIGELTGLVHHHPWRERIAGQLMVALVRDGRQSEALEVCRRVKHRLASEGLDPGSTLRRLEQRILRADPLLEVPGEWRPSGERARWNTGQRALAR